MARIFDPSRQRVFERFLGRVPPADPPATALERAHWIGFTYPDHPYDLSRATATPTWPGWPAARPPGASPTATPAPDAGSAPGWVPPPARVPAGSGLPWSARGAMPPVVILSPPSPPSPRFRFFPTA
jgi:hypothetical protein